MKFHKYSDFFPLLVGEEFDVLCADVKKNGLLEPIITFEESVLDGRNRLRACEKAGVEPKFQEFDGKDALSYVISKNVMRRHLTVGQRAMLALELLPALEKEAAERKKEGGKQGLLAQGKVAGGKFAISQKIAKSAKNGKSVVQAAKMTGVGAKSVQTAKKLKEEAPLSLIADVKSGKMSLNEAWENLVPEKVKVTKKKIEDKHEKKVIEKQDHMVKEYLDAQVVFKKEIGEAIKAAKAGKFAPEHAKFAKVRDSQIRALMSDLEEEFKG